MLGSAVRQALADRGAGVLQLVRRDPVEAGQVRWIPGASTPVSDPESLEGLAAAIHLSGASVAAHRWTSAWKREMWLSRVESTRALASTLAALRQPPKTLMVASATGIYGNRGDELLDESSAPGSGFLADLCREWEAAARPAVEAGIRVVHLRFGVVLGPGAGALAKMLPLFRLGLGGPARFRAAMDELDQPGGRWFGNSVFHGHALAGRALEPDRAAAGDQRGVHTRARQSGPSAGRSARTGVCASAGAGRNGERGAARQRTGGSGKAWRRGLSIHPSHGGSKRWPRRWRHDARASLGINSSRS